MKCYSMLESYLDNLNSKSEHNLVFKLTQIICHLPVSHLQTCPNLQVASCQLPDTLLRIVTFTPKLLKQLFDRLEIKIHHFLKQLDRSLALPHTPICIFHRTHLLHIGIPLSHELFI